MNGDRRRFDPPSGLTGSPLQRQAATNKPNRLSRSFRQTQQTQRAAEIDSPKSQQSDFKTPTRIPRSTAGGGFSEESPHNDSDFQQDIIWDATSPSPNRLGKRGKRGKKHPAGVVDISEIVSRIAPKYGRPKVAEPTLQQWIGDSATIPCTPDVQVPKPKKKSSRPNVVDDLLKLAKQFDFNMFRQDEEEVEELHQQSLELLSEDILDFDNGDQNNFSPLLPGDSQPAAKAAAGTDVQLHPDQHMEDDLDFLFDGPTQHVSGNLSQVSSEVKPASGASSKEASGKQSLSSHGPTAGVSTTNTKGTLANDEFEDDWENDDLLDDSLVVQMTQNPQIFTAPQHCSTQKPSSDIKSQRESPVNVPISQSAASKTDNVRQRTTFKLESNPNFSVRRIQTDTWTNSKVDYSSDTTDKDTQQSGNIVLVKAGSQRTWQTSNTVKSEPQKPQFHQRTSAAASSAKYNSTSATTAAPSVPQKPAVVSSRHEPPAVSDLLDDDLDSFFSSDPVWDDPADDDLLCEMCEDLENQIQSVENVSTKQTLPVGHVSNHQRAALQPANRNQPAYQQHFPQKQAPITAPPCATGGGAVSSLAAGFVLNVTAGVQVNTVTDSFRFTQTKSTLGSVNSSACVQGSSRVQSAPQGNARKDQFTFKRPNNPVSTVTNKVVGKCSAAEIELKKQQAMERRRQRLQAAQNLRART